MTKQFTSPAAGPLLPRTQDREPELRGFRFMSTPGGLADFDLRPR